MQTSQSREAFKNCNSFALRRAQLKRHNAVVSVHSRQLEPVLKTMYSNRDRLIIFDADGTIIDAFNAINQTFSMHGMELGDLQRSQKRHNLFKYLGAVIEAMVESGFVRNEL